MKREYTVVYHPTVTACPYWLARSFDTTTQVRILWALPRRMDRTECTEYHPYGGKRQAGGSYSPRATEARTGN
jgi:hypothetical protein